METAVPILKCVVFCPCEQCQALKEEFNNNILVRMNALPEHQRGTPWLQTEVNRMHNQLREQCPNYENILRFFYRDLVV